MVLVHHDVEAKFVAGRPFVEMALVDVGGLVPVDPAVRQGDAELGLPDPGFGIRGFGEVPDLHGSLPFGQNCAVAIRRAVSAARSRVG